MSRAVHKMLSGQHVLITGGSTGIGLAMAERAAQAGARVSLIARDEAKLQAAAARIAAAGTAPVFTASADVANAAAVERAIRRAEERHGAVEVLVTSAGIAHPGYFEALPLEIFERTMAVNYFGTLYAVKAVVPAMRARGSGAVVMISSAVGLHGFFGYTPYAPSKFAVRGFAESLRAELADTGVRVAIVYPPDTDTPQLAEENRTKPAETKAITAGGGLWSADAVAQVTWAGVARGRFAISPGFQIQALAALHSVLAPALRWWFDRVARQARPRSPR